MRNSTAKWMVAFSAAASVLVILSAVAEYFLVGELSEEVGFKDGTIWGIVGWIVLLPLVLACIFTFNFARNSISQKQSSLAVTKYLRTLEVTFWICAALFLVVPGIYCVVHDIGQAAIILGQLVSFVMFGLLALVFRLLRGFIQVNRV